MNKKRLKNSGILLALPIGVSVFSLFPTVTKAGSSATPDPSDTDEASQTTGARAILTVTFNKEFDLSKKELNASIAWYDAKDAGRGPSFFAIDKYNNSRVHLIIGRTM
ncbi:hypothetical protein J2T18_000395 [Paenibacillus polymyxa]|nr:hypothetical protein [Paenibacillus polymyxa]